MGPALLRVARSGALDPVLNMALDEALLHSPGPPTLRLYGWRPAGLSLGHFQAAEPFSRMCGDHVLVRRATGGGAIYHQDELTFALTVDARYLPASVPDSYDMVHGAIGRALDAVGVNVHTATAAPAQLDPRAVNAWCFAAPGAHDLVARDGRKILGSAQRRIRRPTARLLHHGSLVLRTPDATPFCGAVADWADVSAVRNELEARIVENLAHSLGLEPSDGAVTTAEQRRAADLAELHRDPAYVHRR